MKVHIETDRLVLREFEESDVEGMFALDSDPAVHKYLGQNPITKIKEAAAIIKSVRAQYQEFGIGRWAVIDKKTNDFIGWSGLKYEQKLRSEFKYYDLGYRLCPKYWGRGIATETAIEALKYGFNQMQLKEICAAADIAHGASNKILKKVGLSFIEIFKYEQTSCNWYQITKAEWEELNS